jgi:hypothetical protein
MRLSSAQEGDMTDPIVPDEAGPPSAPPGVAPYVSPEAPPTTPPAPAGRTFTGWRALLIIGVILLPLAAILWVVKDNAAAGDLKVGDCFDVPEKSSVSTVTHHPCTEAHTGEVFLVADYTEGTAYPISLSLDRFIRTTCAPAFEAYVGQDVDSHPDLTIGYFYPSRDGWTNGDRGITCYATREDSGQMTTSVKGT